MKSFATIVSLAICCLLLAPFQAQAVTYKKQTILAASANNPNSYHAVMLNTFKEIVERESDGAIKVKVFLGGSMGDEQSNVKQLRTGELHVATLFTGNLAPFAPSAKLMCLPYLFPNLESAYTFLSNKEFMNKLADRIENETKTRPLGWLVGGYRHLTNSKHPVTRMEDLQGMKIRVSPVDTQLAAFRAWGIEPIPMAWTEVFNALQQGVIDAQENPHSALYDCKMWEVQKYVTELHYLLYTGPFEVSAAWYHKLDPDTRALVDKAVDEALKIEWAWSAEKDESGKKACTEKGMVQCTLEDEEVWIEKARSIWPDFYDKIGGKEFVDEALAIIESAAK